MGIRLYYCDHYEIPLPAGHKFPMAKYSMVRGRLARDGRLELIEAPLADPAGISLAHDPDYVRAILEGSVDTRMMRRIGFPWSRELVQRTLASVGGTLAAARHALSAGVAGNLAGGTHHAFRGEGSGFCVFNDLAVAIHTLRQEREVRRVAVVDLDVHQGDGTASIFADDPSVLTVSIHGANNFPFRKQSSRIDVSLPDGTEDDEYLRVLRDVLPRVWEFDPDLLLYQSGVDALREDRLGRLAMTHGGLIERDRMLFAEAKRRRTPAVITLGGGYADPVECTAEAHANTFRTAAAVWVGPQLGPCNLS
jgi:acetoin utilization deacetylase AcuC-like enzyme